MTKLILNKNCLTLGFLLYTTIRPRETIYKLSKYLFRVGIEPAAHSAESKSLHQLCCQVTLLSFGNLFLYIHYDHRLHCMLLLFLLIYDMIIVSCPV